MYVYNVLALHNALEDNLAEGITDHNPRCCICCTNNPAPDPSSTQRSEAAFPMFKVGRVNGASPARLSNLKLYIYYSSVPCEVQYLG